MSKTDNPTLSDRLRRLQNTACYCDGACGKHPALDCLLPEILQALDDNERVAGILRAEIQRLANDVYGLFCGNCGIIKVAPAHVGGCPKANALDVDTGLRRQITQLESDNARYRATIVQLTPRPVVAAVIRYPRGQYLIAQRRPDQWMGGKWCFAGGKVEAGESLEDAVRREIVEELGINVTVAGIIHQQIERYEHGTFDLHYFDCFMEDVVPEPLEVTAWALVPAVELPSYDLLPVDIDIARRLAMEATIVQLERERKEAVERVQELEMALAGVKNSECWCGVGIGNPMLKAHSSECVAAQAALQPKGEPK